jgi:hypothetical protein
VGQSLVASLTRPGANITGTSLALGEGFAGIRRIPWRSTFVNEVRGAARALHVKLELADVRNIAELDHAFAAIAASSTGGLIVTPDPFFCAHRVKLVQFAYSRRLPTIYFFRDFVDDGGLMAYGASLAEAFRRSASYVDRILKGAKPAELPIEQPTKFDLAINLKTSKALGLTISPSLLARADQVIEGEIADPAKTSRAGSARKQRPRCRCRSRRVHLDVRHRVDRHHRSHADDPAVAAGAGGSDHRVANGREAPAAASRAESREWPGHPLTAADGDPDRRSLH